MKSPAEEIEEQSRRGREMLEEALGSETAVLLAGAGCSISAGYPTWDGLVTELFALANEIRPGFSHQASGQLDKLQEISDWCVQHKSCEAVPRFIGRKFRPTNPAYKDFHSSLLNLPFAGLTTTNYDHVLENAMHTRLAPERLDCVPVNLCDDGKRLDVLDFFRDLGSKARERHSVLHLHGSYQLPNHVMLTANDYRRFYDGVVIDTNGKAILPPNPLTFYRKTIWTLLATRMVVFVGFSLTDDVFNSVLDVLLQDVSRINQRLHVALVGISSVDDMRRQDERFDRLAVAPIYYELTSGAGDPHARLYDFVAELEMRYHVRGPRPTVAAVSSRIEEAYP